MMNKNEYIAGHRDTERRILGVGQPSILLRYVRKTVQVAEWKLDVGESGPDATLTLAISLR